MGWYSTFKEARIWCEKCNASTDDYRTPEEAIEAWNRRPDNEKYT